MVQLAMATWRTYAPDYEVNLINLENYKEHLQEPEDTPRAVGPESFEFIARFSDWLRLALLAKHGGVWLDATLLLTAPLQYLVNESANFSGVHLEDRVESFFLASRAHEVLMQRWRDTLFQIAQMNESAYDQHLVALRGRGIEPLNGAMARCDWSLRSPLHGALHSALHFGARRINAFTRYTNFYLQVCNERYWMHYLRVMVAFYGVIEGSGYNTQELYSKWDLHIEDSMKNVNALAVLLGWNSSDIVHFISTSRSAKFDLYQVRGIKLRRAEWEQLDSLKVCEAGSVICRLQKLTGANIFDEVPAEVSEPPAFEL